jgi:methylisocitrate lyase
MIETPGRTFWRAVSESRPLQIAGAINDYCALLAERAGFRALYLSGAGVANASLGLPDLGMTTRNDVLEDTRRITGATPLPLLVDADTGWGTAFNIARTARELVRAGAAGMHIEDQVEAKRCGHRPNKAVVPKGEMCDRVKAAVDGRGEDDFVVMARTDAVAMEGFDAALERCAAYIEAGADMIFPEALGSLEDYARFAAAVDVPVLANLTEFGLTPSFTAAQLSEAGVSMALYPLSAFRAMSRAAERVYAAIIDEGTQAGVIDAMQTRSELYEVLGYYAYERKLDELYSERGEADERRSTP